MLLAEASRINRQAIHTHPQIVTPSAGICHFVEFINKRCNNLLCISFLATEASLKSQPVVTSTTTTTTTTTLPSYNPSQTAMPTYSQQPSTQAYAPYPSAQPTYSHQSTPPPPQSDFDYGYDWQQVPVSTAPSTSVYNQPVQHTTTTTTSFHTGQQFPEVASTYATNV